MGESDPRRRAGSRAPRGDPRRAGGAARPPRGESRRAAAGRGAQLHPVDRIAPRARAVRQRRRRRAARGRQRLHPDRRLDGRHAHRPRPPVEAHRRPRRRGTVSPGVRAGLLVPHVQELRRQRRPAAQGRGLLLPRREPHRHAVPRLPVGAGPGGARTGSRCSTTSSPPARRARTTGCTAPSAASISTIRRGPGSSPCSIRAPVALVGRPPRPQEAARHDQRRGVHAGGAAADGGRRHAGGTTRCARLRPEPPDVRAAGDPPPVDRCPGIRVAFVRVQRRPAADGPPPQSRGAAGSTWRSCARYLEANGADVPRRLGRP